MSVLGQILKIGPFLKQGFNFRGISFLERGANLESRAAHTNPKNTQVPSRALRSLYSLPHRCVTLAADRLVASLQQNVSTFKLEREHLTRTLKLLFIHVFELTVLESIKKK